MASSSSRKSNSSASNQKPTFRRSSGAAVSRSKRASASAHAGSAPAAAPRKAAPPARTYVAPTKRAAVNRVSSSRAARKGAAGAGRLQGHGAPAAPTRRKASSGSVRTIGTRAAKVRPASSAPRTVSTVKPQAARPAASAPQKPTRREGAPRIARGAASAPKSGAPKVAGSKGASPKGAVKLKMPKRAAGKPASASAHAAKAPSSKTSLPLKPGAVRAKAPSDRKLPLPLPRVRRVGSAPAEGASLVDHDAARASGKTRTSLPRVIAAVAITVVLVVGLCGAILVNSGFFSVTDVRINGSEHVPQQTAEQLIDVPANATLFNVNDDQIASALMQNPWVASVDIEREFPHTIVITPVEHKVAAIVYISADDIAWAVSDDGYWIAPLTLSAASGGTGTIVTDDGAQGDAAGGADGAAPDADADGATDATADADGDGAADDATDVDGDSDASDDTGDADESGTSTDGEGSTTAAGENLSSVEAAIALARDAGAVLLTDVGTDVTPSSGQEVTSEVILAGLKYAKGFSADFLAQIRTIAVPSVEAISANLESGVEVSLGEPDDIQQKEQVVRRLLEQVSGVTYINVRVPDAYTFRSASAGSPRASASALPPLRACRALETPVHARTGGL